MTHFRGWILGWLLCCGLLGAVAYGGGVVTPRQETPPAASTADAPLPGNEAPSAASSGNLFVKMFEGSWIGIGIVILILLLSLLSVFFVIEHALSINRRKLMPSQLITDLEKHVARGEINQALELCYRPENYSLVSEVVAAGLERFQSSEFGFAEYRTAVEEAGEDFTGRLYRKTEVLNVIGSIAPMLGLLGTVVGMIEAFNTIAARQGMARPEELAGGIGQALITTLQGLFVAIPTMVAFSFFRNKIDSLVAEAGKRIERMLLPLGRKR